MSISPASISPALSSTLSSTSPAPPQRMASESPLAAPFDDHLSARLLHQRIVVLGQEVDDAVANRICAQLLLLSAEDPRRDISLYINSPGGSVSAGLAIMDTMRLIPNDVSTLAMGLAASMGQFLLSAGTRGKRHALPHARVLMHQGSAGIGGTAVDIEIQAQNLEHVRDTVLGLIAEHTGLFEQFAGDFQIRVILDEQVERVLAQFGEHPGGMP